MLLDTASSELTVLKEIVRQLEARITVQTQEKMAFEARSVSLMSWLTALLIPVTSLMLYVVVTPNYIQIPSVKWGIMSLQIGFIMAWGFTFLMVVRRRDWEYAGARRWDHTYNEREVMLITIGRYEQAIRVNRSTLLDMQTANVMPAFFCGLGILLAGSFAAYPQIPEWISSAIRGLFP